MKRVTLRTYAKMHKLSYFNVMKMVKNGDVKSEILSEDGKDIPYILIDDLQERKIAESIIETSSQKLSLKDENTLLKKEIARLKLELDKCRG